jgi:hypothetical protein
MRGLVVCIACVAGCDGVFGLAHVYDKPVLDSALVDAKVDAKIDAPIDATPDASACAPAGGGIVTNTFNATADTFVSSDGAHVGSNFGNLDNVFVCFQCNCTDAIGCESVSGGDDDVVALLRFGLTTIVSCSHVVSAKLHLTTNSDNLGGGSIVQIYRVKEDWDEGTGGVASGVAGTANWANRKSGIAWATAGAGTPDSRDNTDLAVTSFAPTSSNTAYPVSLNTAAIQIIQQWVDVPTTNHGLVLVVSGSTSDVHFHSRTSATIGARPTLEITYQLP